jgi:hypothetical protein
MGSTAETDVIKPKADKANVKEIGRRKELMEVCMSGMLEEIE